MNFFASVISRLKRYILIIKQYILRKDHNFYAKSWDETMKKYDMYVNKDENFFLTLYLSIIKQEIKKSSYGKKIKIFDAGCGQGRIAIPLAKCDYNVVGIDVSEEAIKKAIEHSKDVGADIEFKIGDLLDELPNYADGSFDCVLCIEALYVDQRYKKIIKELLRVCKPNGLVFITFRTKYFYIAHFLKQRKLKEALTVLGGKEAFFDGNFFNWQTVSEMKDLMQNSGVKDIEFKSIGTFSGIDGDPAIVLRPCELSKNEMEMLYEIESHQLEDCIGKGRYVLAYGKKL